MEVPARGNVLGRFLPARYILAVLGSVSLAISYGLKVNLSVAMVGMLNHTAIKALEAHAKHNDPLPTLHVEECEAPVRITNVTDKDGTFTWPSDVQGIVLSGYFWGYAVSQIPGGRIAELFSAKWVMFFSVSISVVCALLTPVMAEMHYMAAVAVRVGEGIGGPFKNPFNEYPDGPWFHGGFRIRRVFAWNLFFFISVLSAGLLTVHFGWESVFYVMGALSAIWCVLWVILIRDSPQEQPLISAEERNMMVSSLGGKDVFYRRKKQLSVPWRAVLTSPPLIAIQIAHICSNWGFYMMTTELPFFVKQILKLNMIENAMAISLPFVSFWLFSLTLSRTLDWLRGKSIITTTTARKIGTLIASMVPATCLLTLCYIGCNRTAAVAIMAVALTSCGDIFCGFLSNHIDIAPNYAGTLMALTNTVSTIPGALVPVFVGYMTKGNQTITAWRVVFFVTIGMYIIDIIVYTLLGTGEEQPWNRVNEQEEKNQENRPLKEID